jgi:hypothetical protein
MGKTKIQAAAYGLKEDFFPQNFAKNRGKYENLKTRAILRGSDSTPGHNKGPITNQAARPIAFNRLGSEDHFGLRVFGLPPCTIRSY